MKKTALLLLLLFPFLFTVKQLKAQFQNDTLITREYFGFDFWGINKTFWAEIYTQMDSDTFPFDLVGSDAVNWQKIEPEAPVNGVHSYNWGMLDTLMYYTYLSGKKIDLGIRPLSNWGTVLPADSVPVGEWAMVMSVIKSDTASDVVSWGMTAKQAWKEFIYNLVERYDGDTIGHPNLAIDGNVIRTLTMGNEVEAPGHFFAGNDWNPEGTIEKYKEIQMLAYDTAKYANPDIIVVRGKSNPGHIFDDKPSFSDVYSRRQDFFDSILVDFSYGSDYYDIYTFNYNDHYTSLLGYSAWVKQKMTENGFSKPFMVGDARTTLYPRDNFFETEKIMPSIYTATDTFLVDTASANYEELKLQWQKDKVQQSIRKLVIGGACGVFQISLQPVYVGSDFEQGDTRTYMWMYSGFFDPYIYETTGSLALAREPLYWSLKMFAEEVIGANKQAVDLNLGNNIYAYQYIKQTDDNPIITWHENHFLVDTSTNLLQRNQGFSADFSANVSTSYLLMKHFITQVDTNGGAILVSDTIVAANAVPLDEFPVILLPSDYQNKNIVLSENSIRIYPNPTTNILQISINDVNFSRENIFIYDTFGKIVKQFYFEGNKKSINVGDLPNGIYFVKIRSYSAKFIKQ